MSPRKCFTTFVAIILLILVLTSAGVADSGSNLILNYIESRPAEGQYAYDVSVLFSLLDSTGHPVKDLTIDNVVLSEDGQGVAPNSLDLVQDEPIFLSLLLDTSGSMTGSKIEAARAAAAAFASGLNEEDRLSIISFNSDVTQLTDFTTDRTAMANLLASINAVPKSGTCLYDAAYEAVQRTAALPLGRRAVIILTDGKDELITGGACSKLILDDVIDLATEGSTRVPVYTIGLGDSIDETGLTRLAELTGGRYQKSSDASQLEGLFAQLLNQLQSQYILHYTSAAAPGSHNLVLQVNYLNTNLTDSRGFMLQALPLNISIISPTSGQQITGKVKIVAEITGQGASIKQVVFTANDVTIGTDETLPYELEWIPGDEFDGEVTIGASALGAEDNSLAGGTVQVVVDSTGSLLTRGTGTESDLFTRENIILYGGILAAVVVCVVVFVTTKGKKGKEEKRQDQQWDRSVGTSGGSSSTGTEDMTLDGFTLSENSLGTLMVLQSDDPAMMGQRFEITDDAVRLGRAADNDILFPKDGPVSRHHAIIEHRDGRLTLSEMVSISADGSPKSPTFGTYINDQKVMQPVMLRSGDLIRLGKRVVLRFESSSQAEVDDDARTMDQVTVQDSEKTIDGL